MEIFYDGPISPQLIAETISSIQAENEVGAHNIFLGQIRADKIKGKTVTAIEYTAYHEMVKTRMEEIRNEVLEKFNIQDFRVFHSIGKIKVGEICLFVISIAPHRQEAINATTYLLETIKKELPIFGKEIFGDDSHQWKTNKF